MAPWAAILLCPALVSCGDSNPEITQPHRIRTEVDAPRVNASESERFGMRPQQPSPEPRKPPTAEELFDWVTPEGWETLESSQYRMVNLKVGDVECYLTNVVGDETERNINRWRQQMGAPVLTSEEIEALKSTTLFGQEAYRMDVSGSYTGMSGDSLEDARMLTVIANFPSFALTVKMVGPRDQVETQTAGFELFTGSLTFSRELAQSVSQRDDESDPHAGHNHAPGEGHGAPEAATGELAWDVPSGWQNAGPRTMRHVTFTMEAHPEVECYITILPTPAGLPLDNLNRWLGQVGLDPISAAGMQALTPIPLLGNPVGLLEAMGESSAILATQFAGPQETLFVKMTGPPEGVAAQRSNFIEFCSSLRQE